MTLKLVKILLKIIVLSYILSFLLISFMQPSVGALAIFGCFYLTFTLGLSSIGILLNSFYEIRHNSIATFLTFFLLPVIVSIFLAVVADNDLKFYLINITDY